MMDMISTTGLVICNKGTHSTHNKGSIIDLTIATPRTAQNMSKWMVLDRETLSDYYYILFETDPGPSSGEQLRVHKIDVNRLEALLKSDHLDRTVRTCSDADQCALALTEAINGCRPAGQSGRNCRKSVHWWSAEINSLRNAAKHLRRVFQRKRKKHGPACSEEEEKNAKAARRELANAIKRAKETAWRDLCDLVQKDTWGLPYKLAMDKLTRPPPIPELDTPGRLRLIVDGLFPQHPVRERITWPMNLDCYPNWKVDEA